MSTDFVKLETHVHTKGISLCSHITLAEAVRLYAKAGYQKLLLTNHYWGYHLDALGGDDAHKMGAYIQEYKDAYREGKSCGVDVLLGAEIYIANPDGETGEMHNSEYLTIGLTEELLMKSFPLYALSQAEFFDFCNAHDLLMYQTHPFRIEHNVALGDCKKMHGIEIHNGHLNFNPHTAEAIALSKRENLKMISGSDCHTADGVGRGGIYVPSEIETAQDLYAFLKNNTPILFNQDGVIAV